MSDLLLVAAIGLLASFLGVAVGSFLQARRANRRVEQERLRAVARRLAGELLPGAEVIAYVKAQRGRRWSHFWKSHRPDLRHARLGGIDLHGEDLRQVILFRAHLHAAILTGTRIEGADLRGAD
ncbi:MAG: pentapeptide repeat-containing protein, partial [Ardenticatenaceae bacterium]